MADKELQTILNSGGINTIFLGGTASANKVVTEADISSSIFAIGTSTAKATQTVVEDTPEKLVWMTQVYVGLGDDMEENISTNEITILNSGTFKLGGTINTHSPINDVVSITLYVNGNPTPLKSEVIGRGDNTTSTFVYFGAVGLNSADVITLWVESTGTEVTVDAASVVLEKIL